MNFDHFSSGTCLIASNGRDMLIPRKVLDKNSSLAALAFLRFQWQRVERARLGVGSDIVAA
jgi:hypothetical protein